MYASIYGAAVEIRTLSYLDTNSCIDEDTVWWVV